MQASEVVQEKLAALASQIPDEALDEEILVKHARDMVGGIIAGQACVATMDEIEDKLKTAALGDTIGGAASSLFGGIGKAFGSARESIRGGVARGTEAARGVRAKAEEATSSLKARAAEESEGFSKGRAGAPNSAVDSGSGLNVPGSVKAPEGQLGYTTGQGVNKAEEFVDSPQGRLAGGAALGVAGLGGAAYLGARALKNRSARKALNRKITMGGAAGAGIGSAGLGAYAAS